MDTKFEAAVLVLAKMVDQMDYYQILKVVRTASLGEIRKAYHMQSRQFHPDRFFHLPEGPLREGIRRIAKRIAEAYVTLRDAEKRRFYDQQLGQSQGVALRYTEESAQAQKQAKVEQTGRTEQGRRMYRQGMAEMQRKNFVAAERSFKMALAFEPENEVFKKLCEESGRNIKTDYTIK